MQLVEANTDKRYEGFNMVNQDLIKKNKVYKIMDEIETMLNRGQSISYNDLMGIKSVCRIVFAAVCMQMNNLVSEANMVSAYSKEGEEPRVAPVLFNLYFLAGCVLAVIGFVSSWQRFYGLRITLILLCIVTATFWNIIWMSFSDISEYELAN